MRGTIPPELIRYPSAKCAIRSSMLCIQGWFIKGYSVFITQSDDAEIGSILINTRQRRKRQLKIKGPLKYLKEKGLKNLGLVVKSLRGLNKLILDFHNANDFHMNVIRSAYGHKRLKELKVNLSRGFLPNDTFYKILEEISGLRLLKTLDLSFKKCYHLDSKILSNFNQNLIKLRYLKTLKLDLNNLGGSNSKTYEDFFAEIQTLKSLQTLHLGAEFCHLSVRAVDCLLESLTFMPKITALKVDLSTLPVLPIFTQQPADMETEISNIKYLALSSRGRYQRNLLIVFLARIKKLTKLNLDLAYTTITNSNLHEMTKYISHYTDLSRITIDLSSCTNLSEEGIIKLFDVIKNLKRLKTVKMDFMHIGKQKIITTKSLKVLGGSLFELEHLKKLFLYFGGPNIKKNDFVNMAAYLKNLSNLTSFSVGFDDTRRCSDENFLTVLQGISNMKKLKFLELSFDDCYLHDESLQLLAEALLPLRELKVLILRFRKFRYFTPQGILKFRSLVTKKHSIKKRIIDLDVKTSRKYFLRESVLLLITIIIPLLISFIFFIYFTIL